MIPHAQRVRLEPHVTGMYLRRVNLQHDASYDVYDGMIFSFGPYKWKVDFINMNQLTRSHSRRQLVSISFTTLQRACTVISIANFLATQSPRRRPSGRFVVTPTIPGIPHLRIYKSPEGSCFADHIIWLPGTCLLHHFFPSSSSLIHTLISVFVLFSHRACHWAHQ